MLYRGIAARAFERRFQLADHVEVTGASSRTGCSTSISSRDLPEEKKPRRIAIGAKPKPGDRRQSQGGLIPRPFER